MHVLYVCSVSHRCCIFLIAAETPTAPYSEEFKRAYPNAPIFFPGNPLDLFLSSSVCVESVTDVMIGSYMEAVRHARSHGRLLFVYLHAPAHDDTPAFCRYRHFH
jgi:hypothetical protein